MKACLKNTAWLMAVLLLATGCTYEEAADNGGGGTDVAATYDSPQAAFDALKTAAANNDVNKFMSCMTDKSQKEFAFMTVMMSGFLPMQHMDDEAKAEALGKEVEEIMAKHGLKESEMEAMDMSAEPDFDKFFAPVDDVRGLVTDLFVVINREDPETPLKMIGSATMENVNVDGEKATGTLKSQGEEQPIEFVKVGDGWLVQMPSGPPA